MESFISKSSYLSLTVDIWTDRRMHSFLGATVHMFDNGVPESRLLAFKSFSESHTGAHIAEALDEVIQQNGLHGKVSTVVTDNASNMRKALSLVLEVSESSVVTDNIACSLWCETGWQL